MDACAICLDAINGGEHRTVCGHAFHCACIKRWLEHGSACPLCRVQLREPHKPQAADARPALASSQFLLLLVRLEGAQLGQQIEQREQRDTFAGLRRGFLAGARSTAP